MEKRKTMLYIEMPAFRAAKVLAAEKDWPVTDQVSQGLYILHAINPALEKLAENEDWDWSIETEQLLKVFIEKLAEADPEALAFVNKHFPEMENEVSVN